jgi:F-type H+-transporting ATPase subunit delta
VRDPRVAHRYAHALFQVAITREMVDMVASELFQLRSFAEKDKRFLKFLEAPQILKEDKEKLIVSLFTTRLSPPLVSFILLLIEKNRIEFLSDIARDFEGLLEGYRDIVKARVTTAVSIDDDFKQSLRIKLEKLSGKKIDLIHKIDKRIIGGIVVQLNYKVIDRSVRHELDSLKHDLMSLKVY